MLNSELRQAAEEALQHTFSSEALLREALTHASLADNRLLSNERMEFLGDAVLDLVVCEELYRRFPQHAEGELTKIKSAVVSRKTCAEVAREIGVDKFLLLGKGISQRGQMPSSLSAAVYESLVAAMYLDAGLEKVREFILRTMARHIDTLSTSLHQNNYKAALQQHAQGKLNAIPVYELLDEKGPDHSKCFEVCVCIGDMRFESAWGTNKKIAEQKAALRALLALGVIADSEIDSAMEAVDNAVVIDD